MVSKVSRIYRRESIKCGSWYYAVTCKGCRQANFLLDDPSGGSKSVTIDGDGKISAPCIRCGHDAVYLATELRPVQALESIQGPMPPRVQSSNASRKPLLQNKSSARVTFGVGYIEDRPKAAAIVARIITAWADVEVQSARLLAALMGTNIRAAAAVFGSLRSGRAQHDALQAAARIVLDRGDYELFSAYMARRNALEGERNDLAHGCFGVSPAIPEHVVWVSQADFLEFTASHEHDPDAENKFRAHQAIYELGTLERIAQEISEFYEQLGLFRGYLSASRSEPNGAAFRAQQYPRLCGQPHIRQALHNIRTATAASRVPPRERPSKKRQR